MYNINGFAALNQDSFVLKAFFGLSTIGIPVPDYLRLS